MATTDTIWSAARRRSTIHAVAAIGAVAISIYLGWVVTRLVELQKPTDAVVLYVLSTIFMFFVALIHVFLAVGFGIKVAILRNRDADTVTLETKRDGSQVQTFSRLKVFSPFRRLKLTTGGLSYNVAVMRDDRKWWFLVTETEIKRNVLD